MSLQLFLLPLYRPSLQNTKLPLSDTFQHSMKADAVTNVRCAAAGSRWCKKKQEQHPKIHDSYPIIKFSRTVALNCTSKN